MKITHVITGGKYAPEMVRFLNEYFVSKGHEILFCNVEGNPSLVLEQCQIAQDEIYRKQKKCSTELIEKLNQCQSDYIVLHNLFFLTNAEKILLLLKPKLLRRIVWIEWGADLYSWRIPRSNKGTVKRLILNTINKVLRYKFNNIICIFPPDMEYYKKTFPGSHAKLHYAPYFGYPLDMCLSDYTDFSRLAYDIENGNTIYIQIGHNAMKTLNHERVLTMLSKFSEENIRILLPLSYGAEKDYIDYISRIASKLFPGKVTILNDFIPETQYFELLDRVDIAIFDTERQCALGNIHMLNFKNKKIFLSEHGTMYNFFIDEGVPVQKCEDIPSMTYEEFSKPLVISNNDKFSNYLYWISDITPCKMLWETIFEELEKKI